MDRMTLWGYLVLAVAVGYGVALFWVWALCWCAHRRCRNVRRHSMIRWLSHHGGLR